MRFGYSDRFSEESYHGDIKADKDTQIRSRDAFGNPGVFNLPKGLDERVKIKDGKKTIVVDNAVNDGLDYIGGSPGSSPGPIHNRQVKVTTPDGDGNGGTIDCMGHCRDGGGRLGDHNQACGLCHWTEHLGSVTDKGKPSGGWREITVYDPTSYTTSVPYDDHFTVRTPRGQPQTCVSACHIVQVNEDAKGRGGGAVCSASTVGSSCSGPTKNGTGPGCNLIGCTTRVLYEDPKSGKNEGWSCNKGCTNYRPDLRFDYHGDPNSFWLAGQGSSIRRPSLNNSSDRGLAKALGLKPGDKLPLLDRSGYES